MKRIVTVQDISCIGKCSLTVALPIISALGVETVVLPTALLSAHTAFDGFTFCDLTDNLPKITDHWKEQKFEFDGIYSGYLGSFDQIEQVESLIRDYPNALSFVDPAMGDNGKLYSGFTPDFAQRMAKLCAKADIIAPNLTEAAYLLGEPYAGDKYDEEYIKNTLRRLCALGCRAAVLTGVSFDDDRIGAYGYDSEKDSFFYSFSKKHGRFFHGTGDIFASVTVGCLVHGSSLPDACRLAAEFVSRSIEYTLNDPSPNWYGVNFEQALGMLTSQVKEA